MIGLPEIVVLVALLFVLALVVVFARTFIRRIARRR